MSAVLVTGGTGGLGRLLVPRLLDAGHDVRVLSRSGRAPGGARAARGDLATGEGVRAALEGIEVIVHCATSPQRRTRAVDVGGTREILRHAERGARLVYPSIVGVDRNPMRYYRAKLAAERIIERAGVAWSIQRVTQFHEYIAVLLDRASKVPVMSIPKGFRLQPIAAAEVADRLADLASGPPAGRVDDMGGPEVRTGESLAEAYRQARGRPRAIVPVPVPGHVARAFRLGTNIAPEHAVGKETWEAFLAR